MFLTILFVSVSFETHAGTNYGVEGQYTIRAGEQVTLQRRYQHYPDKWSRVNWVVSNNNVKIVSQNDTYCTVEGVSDGSARVTCQMYYYGDISYSYYDIKVDNTIIGRTLEGTEMKFEITDVAAKTCKVAPYTIVSSVSGNLTVPSIVNGYKVTEIGEFAFCSNSAIEYVIIPNSVTIIGHDAFKNCSSLTTITIPNSVTTIDDYTFYGCKCLTSVDIPNSVTTLGRGSFRDCTNLEDVYLSTSLKSLKTETFYGCDALAHIKGGNSIEHIETNAFSPSFAWISNLSEGMNFIGKVLFKYQGKMPANTTINIPVGCTQIYAYDALAYQKGLVGVYIPASVKEITHGALRSCPNLQMITVEASNPNYDSRSNCNAIIEKATNRLTHGCNNTTIPANVTSIGIYAFSGNWTKDEIIIPNQIESIDNIAFGYNNSVKRILIGKNLKQIGWLAFADLPHLKEIAVSTGNPYFDSRDNCNAIVEKATKTIVVGCSTTSIPNTVKAIGSYAFYGNGDEDLTSLVIPNSVEEIESCAFEALPYLCEVSIGANVKTFGVSIFDKCNNLKAIESLNGFPYDIGAGVFRSDIYDNVTLYVPVGCRNNYRLATGWSNFKNIVEGSLHVGIDDVLAPQPEEDIIYSPAGARLSAPQRGVNIVNGKKLLVK